jgi:hypothetical protein
MNQGRRDHVLGALGQMANNTGGRAAKPFGARPKGLGA